VGLEPAADSSGFEVFSLEAFSSLPVPPEVLSSFVAPDSPSDASPLDSASVDSVPLLVDVFVAVVDVEVVEAAAFSALVSAGGVMSGVLFGAASETLLPPHDASARAHRIAVPAASGSR
jgi:hypothetical protein